MGAQRFPGKPLAVIAGKPLVQRVWEAASAAKKVTRVIVATDDERIIKVVHGFGGEAVMTPKLCPSGTDRVAYVARRSRAGIVVNVQGDEPLLSPRTIDQVVSVLQSDPDAVMSTAVRRPESDAEWRNPNAVKAVVDRKNRALYFSRAPLPWSDGNDVRSPRWVHIGLYAFKRNFLFRFAALAPSPLEKLERLEQLRVLEHGFSIKVVVSPSMTQAIDRPDDVGKVERILAKAIRGNK
jgi:3-deoxy-manno-octulosonate cytidylyltransferase (CMP-KDO synthetase)